MTIFGTKWRIRVLKARIEALRARTATVADDFQSASNDTEKARLARRFDKLLKRTHSKQLELELLERKEAQLAKRVTDP